MDIAVEPNGTPWVVNAAGAIFRNVRGQWHQLDGCASDIGVGQRGQAWILGCSDSDDEGGKEIFRYAAAEWQAVRGGAITMTVDPDGRPWILDSAHRVHVSKWRFKTAFYGQTLHDATGDQREDILLSPSRDWQGLSVGVNLATGGFDLQSPYVPELWDLVAQGGRMLAGDFDGDGLQDVALIRGADWSTVPVFFNQGNGRYRFTNEFVEHFPGWSRTGNVTAVVGDFNADGRADIALAGGAHWSTTPIALSRGDGSFEVTNPQAGDFALYAGQSGAKLLAGDFDGDGYSDLALTGGAGWWTIPVRFTRSWGAGFMVTNVSAPDFATYATQAGAVPLAGDFNGDGKTDLALTGGVGWSTIPVALSAHNGEFMVTNERSESFALWATQGASPVVGDFDDDRQDDIALVGGAWTTVPIAYASTRGTAFWVSNDAASGIAAIAAISGVRPVTGVVRP